MGAPDGSPAFAATPTTTSADIPMKRKRERGYDHYDYGRKVGDGTLG
jgi:hypothetical protein